MKAPICVGVFLWSTFSVCPSITPNNSLKSGSAFASSFVSAQARDQVAVPAFYVNVMLSERAQRRLAAPPETIIVSVSLYGQPKVNSPIEVNDVGSVDLADHQIELSRAGQAQFNNMFISAWKLDQLSSQDYKVNINVFSGRRSTQDNLLDCDFFDDTIAKLKPGIDLRCKLINE